MTTDTATPRTLPDRGHLPDLLNDNKMMLAKITELERDLRECVELLNKWLALDEQYGWSDLDSDTRALLARIKGTPNLSALQESDDERA